MTKNEKNLINNLYQTYRINSNAYYNAKCSSHACIFSNAMYDIVKIYADYIGVDFSLAKIFFESAVIDNKLFIYEI